MSTRRYNQNLELATHPSIFLTFRRGYTPGVTPVPIPNTAVKTRRADDTAFLNVEK